MTKKKNYVIFKSLLILYFIVILDSTEISDTDSECTNKIRRRSEDNSSTNEKQPVIYPPIYAQCQLDLVLVSVEEHIPKNELIDSYKFMPKFIRLQRCGGECVYNRDECSAVESEKRQYKILKNNISTISYSYITVELEVHTKCRCNCKIKEQHCNKKQVYNSSLCSCSCNNHEEKKKCQEHEKDGVKQWNDWTCTCNCVRITECSTGFKFDEDLCKCIWETKNSTNL